MGALALLVEELDVEERLDDEDPEDSEEIEFSEASIAEAVISFGEYVAVSVCQCLIAKAVLSNFVSVYVLPLIE